MAVRGREGVRAFDRLRDRPWPRGRRSTAVRFTRRPTRSHRWPTASDRRVSVSSVVASMVDDRGASTGSTWHGVEKVPRTGKYAACGRGWSPVSILRVGPPPTRPAERETRGVGGVDSTGTPYSVANPRGRSPNGGCATTRCEAPRSWPRTRNAATVPSGTSWRHSAAASRNSRLGSATPCMNHSRRIDPSSQGLFNSVLAAQQWTVDALWQTRRRPVQQARRRVEGETVGHACDVGDRCIDDIERVSVSARQELG